MSNLTTTDILSMLDKVEQMHIAGQTSQALDILLECFDDEFHKGNFLVVNETLNLIDVNKFGLQILMGVLSATGPGKHRLISRTKFLEVVKKRANDLNRSDALPYIV